MVTRRRGAQMLTGMRLGDMAAALEGRRLRRAEQRDDDERTARRFHAGNVAISQILGGLDANAERKRKDARLAKQDARQAAQDARQARLDKAAEEEAAFNRSRLTAEDERRQADHEAKRRDRSLSLLTPGMEVRADEALEPDAVGAWIFDGSLEGDGGVEVVDAKGSAVDDMVTTLESAGFSRAEAESLARDALRGAEGRQAQRVASSQAADRQAADDERKARIAEAQLALTNAKTETEKARARKALAEARKASRVPPKKPERERTLTGAAAGEEAGLNAAIGALEQILAEKDKFNTGPLAGRASALLEAVDLNPSGAEFRARVGSLLAEQMKAISGAAISDKERAFLLQNLPNVNDDDETFKRKAQVSLELMRRKRDELRRSHGLEAQGGGGAPAARKPSVEEEDAVLRDLGVM